MNVGVESLTTEIEDFLFFRVEIFIILDLLYVCVVATLMLVFCIPRYFYNTMYTYVCSS
jgi:hypothetical protein